MNDKELREKALKEYQETLKTKIDYPTEIVTLPSKGFFYPSGHPLFESDGRIELKYPTAREEDILTSKNLIQKGVVLDKFFESIIVTKLDYNSLLLGDKNGIMFSARILAYGSDYAVEVTCPKCNAVNKDVKIDLTSLEAKEIDFNTYVKGQQEFDFQLPTSKKQVKFKLLTHIEDKEIEKDLQGLKKLRSESDFEITTRLKHSITEVDGNKEKAVITNLVNTMLSRDSLALRSEIARVSPDISSDFNFECNSCMHQQTMTIPMELSFFWPSGRL